MWRQLRAVIEADGEARFTHWGRATDDHAPKTMRRLGVRKPVTDGLPSEVIGWHYYFFVEQFRNEVCAGFDYKAVLKLLRERGALLPDKGRPFDCKPRLPGMGPTVCYCINSSMLETDSEG